MKSSDLNQFAFVLAQEQDGIRSKYDPLQSFWGKLTELNIWNTILDQRNISSMANCEKFEKGNVISWDQQKMIFNSVEVSQLNYKTSL